MHSKKMKRLETYLIEEREAHYRFVYGYMKNEADAMDVLQDSIVKAIDKIEQLKKEEAMRSWFYQILSFTAIDALRKRKRSITADVDFLDAVCEPEEDVYEAFDLIRAMEALSVNQQTVIKLRYFESFKIEEIAYVLDENVNTIKTRLYGALKKLRITLEEGEA